MISCAARDSYISIPQVNKDAQQAAINSIAIYAALSRYFVIVAPKTKHTNTMLPCGPESYLGRGWCRLEQWARISMGGLADIYLYDGLSTENGVS